jgi:hypothetical protein
VPFDEQPYRLTQIQSACLTSAIRIEILQTLIARGPLAGADLSQALGHELKKILYHLGELKKVELVRVKERRPGVSRPHTVFESMHQVMSFGDPNDPTQRVWKKKGMAAALRLALREHDQCIDRGYTDGFMIARGTYMLTPEDGREFAKLIQDVVAFAHAHHDPERGRRTSLTALILPVGTTGASDDSKP